MKKLRCFEEQIPGKDVETNSKGHELKSFDEMEGEDTMEKRLRVFRARSYVAFDRAKSFGRKYHCVTLPV